MRITDIEISNMFCFGDKQKLVFDKPVYQIIGERDGIENQSNGTGKSSIYYVIQEILFGKNIKGTLKDYTGNVFTNPTTYSGTVNFIHNGNSYSVKLSRKSGKANLAIFENGKDISDHTMPKTYKVIADVIGIDYELFTMLTYLSPTISTPNILFFGTPKEKLMLFTKLFNLEEILNKVEKAKEIAKTQEVDILSIERQIKAEKPIIVPAEPARPENFDLPGAQQRLLDLQIKQKDLRDRIVARNKHSQLVEEKSKLEGEIANLSKDHKYDEAEYKYYKADMDTRGQVVHNLKFELNKLNDVHEVCPTCGATIQYAGHIEAERAAVFDKLQKATNYYISAEAAYKRYAYIKANEDKIVAAKNRLKAIVDFLGDDSEPINVADAEREISRLDAEKLALEQQIKVHTAANMEYVRLKSEYDLLERLHREQTIKLANLNESLLQSKDGVKYYNTIHEHLGLSGFIAEKVSTKAEQLTKLINDYLASFSNGTLTIRLLSGNKINFKLLKDNRELPTNNLSAGQTTMLQLSSILALRDLVNASKGVAIDLLVLDELFGTLDEVRRSILIDTMRDISLRGGHKVLSISHLHYDPAIPTITVKQKEGISEIIQ